MRENESLEIIVIIIKAKENEGESQLAGLFPIKIGGRDGDLEKWFWSEQFLTKPTTNPQVFLTKPQTFHSFSLVIFVQSIVFSLRSQFRGKDK